MSTSQPRPALGCTEQVRTVPKIAVVIGRPTATSDSASPTLPDFSPPAVE